MILSQITALAKNLVIGKNNQLPWSIPEDLAYFKKMTTGKIMIMGRKTFESLGKPLPNRFHIVITRNPDYKYEHERVVIVKSLDEAIALAKSRIKTPDEEVFIVGGGEIYKESLNISDRLYLTLIDKEYEGDAYYPEWRNQNFKLVSEDKKEGYSFCLFEKK